eukprot:1411044-Lingulodinium_polyedra.AAC.1
MYGETWPSVSESIKSPQDIHKFWSKRVNVLGTVAKCVDKYTNLQYFRMSGAVIEVDPGRRNRKRAGTGVCSRGAGA